VQKRRILVLGYPKSGTTWVTRLTAELLGAPVKGFWREPRNGEFEGADRVSSFEVFRGHHTYDRIRNEIDLSEIVYVARDVRDVAVSGACYFSFRPRKSLDRLAFSLRKRLTGAAGKRREDARKLSEMLRILSEGDVWPSPWCAQPWDRHVAEFIRARAFVIRYEDLLAAPERECARLLRHLGVVRSRGHVLDAILTQSFVSAKRRFLAIGKMQHARFLREGRSGEWVERLSQEQSAFCAERFGPALGQLGYEPWRNPTTGADLRPHIVFDACSTATQATEAVRASHPAIVSPSPDKVPEHRKQPTKPMGRLA